MRIKGGTHSRRINLGSPLQYTNYLFDYMISYMSKISHEVIGAAKIVLYAVPQAVSFYKRHGFKEFGDTMYGDEGYYVEGCKPMYLDLNV